ncbi:MAG: septum formation protein Maf [Spirochaetales bacterium]|nr:septum formation protein Maf [Spirochaetales bacterium]
MVKIILASASPRRREILTQLKIPFEVIEPDIDERILPGEPTEEAVTRLANNKVENIREKIPKSRARWILGVDTLVELEGKLLGKPADSEEAVSMIRNLAGKIHRVITGMALLSHENLPVDLRFCTSEVKFAPMSEKEVQFYVNSGEWEGVAGAYRIQERAAFFIEWINGSYSNIVGLPISVFYGMLKDNHYPF